MLLGVGWNWWGWGWCIWHGPQLLPPNSTASLRMTFWLSSFFNPLAAVSLRFFSDLVSNVFYRFSSLFTHFKISSYIYGTKNLQIKSLITTLRIPLLLSCGARQPIASQPNRTVGDGMVKKHLVNYSGT